MIISRLVPIALLLRAFWLDTKRWRSWEFQRYRGRQDAREFFWCHCLHWETNPTPAQTIDQCVEQKNPQCIDITWKYIEFFCGNTFPCQSRGVPESTLQQGLEKAMHNVEKNFFVVGVLEQFDDTLHLFEKLLPRYFNGATEVYHSDS